MPKWWPFKKSESQQNTSYKDEETAYRQAVVALQRQIAEELHAGTSRQAILKTVQAESETLAQASPTSETKGRLRAYDELYEGFRTEMMRNLQNGRALEMSGRVDEAIPFYETAVADQMSTRFPYEHLRIIAAANTLTECASANRPLPTPFSTQRTTLTSKRGPTGSRNSCRQKTKERTRG